MRRTVAANAAPRQEDGGASSSVAPVSVAALASQLAAFKEAAKANFSSAGRVLAAGAVSFSLDTPAFAKEAARQRASREGSLLAARLFYAGDVSAWHADLGFFGDGGVLLLRDSRRLFPILLRPAASLTGAQAAAREAYLADLRSLFPFTMLVLNTFPITPAVLRWVQTDPLAMRAPKWMRDWLLPPTSFSQSRLARVQLARERTRKSAE